MESRMCGRGSLELPILGIGAWSFGGGSYWGAQDQKDVDDIVSNALDLGCTYFDTAEVYNDGDSEISLGKALKGKRGKAIIGSKVSPDHAYPKQLRIHCEASLKRLDTDYVDLYMIHWPIHAHALRHYTNDPAIINSPPSVREALEMMTTLKKEGKIRHIGVSNFGVEQLSEILDMGFEIDVNELCYNMLFRAAEYEVLPLCRDRNVGVISYMPLMQGLLSGKYSTIDEIPYQRTRTRHFNSARKESRHGEAGHEEILISTLANLQDAADEHGAPMHHIALAWILKNDMVQCNICGVRSVEQLEDNVNALDIEISDSVYEELNEVTDELKSVMGVSLDPFESTSNSRIW